MPCPPRLPGPCDDRHAATAGDGCTDNACCATGDNPTARDRPVDDSATLPGRLDIPVPAAPHRPGGHSRVPELGRRARPCDRCPRPAPGVRPPRAFPRRSRRRRSRRPRALEARPARHRLRHHGRGTGCHRGHRHALARPDVLVLAATGRPGAGARLRSLRLRPAPRRRDRATASRHHRARAAPRPLSLPALRSLFLRGWTTTSPSSAPSSQAGSPRGSMRRGSSTMARARVRRARARRGPHRGPAPHADHRPVLMDGYRATDEGAATRGTSSISAP